MQNITFLSLSIYSLLSSSPFYAINRNSYKKFSFIANSYIHHSISSIIYSNTEFHSTKIHKNVYNQMLNTPLVFENEELGFCMSVEKCCVGNDYNFTVGSIISNQNITEDSFPNYGNKNSFFVGDCGDLKITQCQFLSCYSTNSPGGGIRVEQECEVILHNCIFDECYANKHGGAGAIAKKIDQSILNTDSYGDVNHDLTEKLDIQYTCFQNCYLTNSPGFGAALYMGAQDITFYYASTVDCHSKSDQESPSWGAQFDIQANSSNSSQFINVTGGYSRYCGAMEYRHAVSGFFRYQTIIGMECKYSMSFTSVSIDDLSITSCNVFNNTLHTVEGENENSNPPALIFVRLKDLLVENFYFKDNNLGIRGLLAAKENADSITIKLNG